MFEVKISAGVGAKHKADRHSQDCVARAISHCTAMDYEAVIALLVKLTGCTAEDARDRFNNQAARGVLGELGFSKMEKDGDDHYYTHGWFPTKGNYFVFAKGAWGHATAICDGVLVDAWDCNKQLEAAGFSHDLEIWKAPEDVV